MKMKILKILVIALVVVGATRSLELIAIVEHVTGVAIGNGYCRVLNIKALHGEGELQGGIYTDNKTLTGGHVRGFKDGKRVELACIDCEPLRIDAVIHIKNYRIIAATVNSNAAGNLRYVRAALWTDWALSKLEVKGGA